MDNLARLEALAAQQAAFPGPRKSISHVTPASNGMELGLLRQFFDLWNELHSLDGDKRSAEYKKKGQEIAAKLVEKAAEVHMVQGQ